MAIADLRRKTPRAAPTAPERSTAPCTTRTDPAWALTPRSVTVSSRRPVPFRDPDSLNWAHTHPRGIGQGASPGLRARPPHPCALLRVDVREISHDEAARGVDIDVRYCWLHVKFGPKSLLQS